jgi:hypothetical protein
LPESFAAGFDHNGVLAWCEGENGCKYDLLGAINSGIGIPLSDPSRWFCSEIAAAVLDRCGVWQGVPRMPSPNALYLWVAAKLKIQACFVMEDRYRGSVMEVA